MKDKVSKIKNALTEAPFFCRLFTVFVAGVGLSFIQAPYHFWPLLFICFGLFYFLYAQTKTKWQAFLTGFVFAFGYFAAGLYWIGNALLVEGNEYQWVWPLAVIALPATLALFTALYATISHILFNKDRLSGFLGFCVLLVFSEWVRGYAFTGFPWNLYGYGWMSVPPIAQSVSFFGSYGLTFLTIFWGCSFGLILLNAPAKKMVGLITILSLIVVYGFGLFRLIETKKEMFQDTNIHIVQANIKQKDKWDPAKLVENFDKHIKASIIAEPATKNIIIWPETSLPPAFLNSVAVEERIGSIALQSNAVFLTGSLHMTRERPSGKPLYRNSLSFWDGKKAPKHLYAKSHLVPFGEYIPFQQYIPLTPVTNFSGFVAGDGPETIELDGYSSFSPLICYEIIFPHQAVSKNDPRPDFILTVTNDAWYGDSPGPYQHFAQARFRAIEQGIPVVRSANTGISGIIGPYGEVIEKTTLGEGAIVSATLVSALSQKTYYSMWGDKPFFGMMILCLFIAICFNRRHFS